MKILKPLLLFTIVGLSACQKDDIVQPAPVQASSNGTAQVSCNSEMYSYIVLLKDPTTNDYLNNSSFPQTYYRLANSAVTKKITAELAYPLCINLYHADFVRFYIVKPDSTEVFAGSVDPHQNKSLLLELPLEVFNGGLYASAFDSQVGRYTIKIEYGMGTYSPNTPYQQSTAYISSRYNGGAGGALE